MNKTKILVDEARCKGCYYCIKYCPKDAVRLSGHINAKGYETVEIDEEKCIGCGSCYRMCPDYVFELR
ncbi:dissimilatory sulfite reductase (desulfoviridin), alpha/beta subunit [Desulfosporosinus orientis DSM 765]|uniref:Dissimilatory sulfite reductase (Desulfoviridin), alpha/beta subunit n=1 Tax=Desulfosporosinus orientis (strain ATCC 19365 / DSM 765 / NCIMB 8382 / VKM B-1628 / Singapore I) TaxID=768706 RepID=G7WB02_DESOD|nr:4Fe-4S binding protein [Desulfosporosinus orientis]AET67503.1 dissimilatory sulfite reductase (desulfoviridin), alpha/beta subunit [Desulfosporosinus orientis DSM 765]